MKIYEIVVCLRSGTSSKVALEIVEQNTKCHETLRFLCNPYIKTGLCHVKALHEDSLLCSDSQDTDYLVELLLEYFSSCGPDGNRAEKEDYAKTIYEYGPDDEDWKWFVELVATHGNSSAFGVGPQTLRKAGINVPSFGCQLGVKLQDVGSDSWLCTNGYRQHHWRITEKIDGTRRLFIKNKGKVEAYSRSGKKDDKLKHITDWFESKTIPDNRIYDCELVDGDMYDNWKEGYQSFELRAKSIGKAARKSSDNTSLIAICFDYYDFEKPHDNTVIRTIELKRIFRENQQDGPVRLVKIFGKMDGYERDKLDSTLKTVLDRGGEGLMLQELGSSYVFERTPNLIKVKRLEDYTGKIVKVVPGRIGTRLENLMSAILCEVDGCDSMVYVGTGLSDYDRELFAKYADELIGAKVEIEAFSKTINKDGKTSLCFPVFKRCHHKIFKES